jgi:hypothetical protein
MTTYARIILFALIALLLLAPSPIHRKGEKVNTRSAQQFSIELCVDYARETTQFDIESIIEMCQP